MTRPIQDDPDVTSDLDDPSRPPSPPAPPAAASDADGSTSGPGPTSFASDPSHDLFKPQDAKSSRDQPGGKSNVKQMGRYRLLGSPDGQSPEPVFGGEGCVYRAQPLTGGPHVALKTPLARYATHEKRCSRLIHEAKQLRSMDHPAIVKVFDIDDQHQPPYYTMTLLPGGSLSQKLKEDQPLGTDEVLRLAIPLADAVRYVHESKGVSHRDIKPQNVMLDEDDNPVFVDFGLSRDNTGDLASIVDAAHDATSQRFKVGTLLYMAPELFEGKAGNSQTDIYAFGVMLYVMSTGKRPYDGRDFESLSNQKRMHNPPEPLSVYPQLDSRLAQIIGHATARRAKDRYATMEDLLEDLQAIRDGHAPIHAPRKRNLAAKTPPPPAPEPSAFVDAGDDAAARRDAPGRGNPGDGDSAWDGGSGSESRRRSRRDPRDKARRGWGKTVAALVLLALFCGTAFYLGQRPDTLDAARVYLFGDPTQRDNPLLVVDEVTPDIDPAADASATAAAMSSEGIFADDAPGTESLTSTLAPGSEGTPGSQDTPAPGSQDTPGSPDTPAPGSDGVSAPRSESTAPASAEAGQVSGDGEGTGVTATGESVEMVPPADAGVVSPAAAEAARLALQIPDRLEADPELDARAVESLDAFLAALAEAESAASSGAAGSTQMNRGMYREAYREWTHRAARQGAAASLAWLAKHAEAFDLSAATPLPSGDTWLQSAVRSAENTEFARQFPAWLVEHEIDPAILSARALGTRSPLQMAEALGREAWQAALREAADAAGVSLEP